MLTISDEQQYGCRVYGMSQAIRGMRNPLNSWHLSDSTEQSDGSCVVGQSDYNLMQRLASAGPDHRKFMRMIAVYIDITAPLYWWKEFDTYKVGTVANSCSTMHKIAAKRFTIDDFSTEHLLTLEKAVDLLNNGEADELLDVAIDIDGRAFAYSPLGFMRHTIEILNKYREKYLETKDKVYWWQLIQLLPSSYNQKRTIMLNYEVLANIYTHRRNHKLDEWRAFCTWIEALPYFDLIQIAAGKDEGTDNQDVDQTSYMWPPSPTWPPKPGVRRLKDDRIGGNNE